MGSLPHPPLERFYRSFMPEPMSGCWLWTGSVDRFGYGRYWVAQPGGLNQRHRVTAHKQSWLLHRGPVPAGLHVLHRCDVRCCVNPDHLFLGTHQENMADMVAKGRKLGKPGIHRPRITPEQIAEIRRQASTPKHIVARDIGISPRTVQYYRNLAS